ncbi:MAG: hypothetical protein ABJZ55_05465 [Fuerstiella sp.]
MIEMFSNIPSQPMLYQMGLFLTVALAVESLVRIRYLKWAFGSLAFCTIGLWYFIDPIYRAEEYTSRFSVDEQSAAYAQVIVFLLALRLSLETFVGRTRSSVLRGFDPNIFASQRVAKALITLWAVLFFIGVARMDFRVLDALFPVSGRWDRLWARPRFGGSTAFLVSVGEYSYQIICAGFGLVAVATRKRRVRSLMIIMMLITWPMFLLSGTRHHLLAVGLPTVLAILVLKQWSRAKQISFLLILGLILNTAFLIVIQYRNSGISNFFEERYAYEEEPAETKHLGLNMPMELMYLQTYQENGDIAIEWGYNYFAHVVNFVPRAVWADKPFPGEEFSDLRVGRNYRGDVNATISHGIVGQGVTNFGPWLGPIAAALIICSLTGWTCQLTSHGNPFLRACLILVVMGKIPNLGRDLTLFAAWPVIFGYAGIVFYEKQTGTKRNATSKRKTPQAS